MDQSNRYADLSLREADLIAGGRHILVAYKMKPKPGHGYLEAAAHFAAESSIILRTICLSPLIQSDTAFHSVPVHCWKRTRPLPPWEQM